MGSKKAVFDTNIYISAILFGGNPRQCLQLARNGKFELFTSRAILLELATAMRNKFNWKDDDIKELIEGLGLFTKVVYPKIKISRVKESPKDNRILECALAVQADYIVSGDKRHLLSLKKFPAKGWSASGGKNIPIITPKQFLDLFYSTLP